MVFFYSISKALTSQNRRGSFYVSDKVYGKTEPRLWTPPLRQLTPETTYGFEVIEFAKSIGSPLDEWQEWFVIHAGELFEDGRPRFRKILCLVSRQNGKTTILAVLALYWLIKAPAEMGIELVGGLSTNLGVAKEAWKKAEKLAIKAGIEYEGRYAAGEECIRINGREYRIAASNTRGFRGSTLDRIIVDELREHDSRDAMDAVEPTMNARPHGQLFMISNQGGDKSVVLDEYRSEALTAIENGEPTRLGIFEWSAHEGADPEDIDALAQANPNLGYRLDLDDLLRDAKAAKLTGGQRLAGFKTENMCMRVHHLDPAIDPDKWLACCVPAKMDKANLAFCLDVAMDNSHVTLMAATGTTTTRLEVVKAWDDVTARERKYAGALAQARAELPGVVERNKPKVIGWFPNGPAAQLATGISFNVRTEEIRGEVVQVCMEFADLVNGRLIRHSEDATSLLNVQINSASKRWQGDGWRFARKNEKPVDAVYAAAGATYLARTLPPPKPPLVVKAF